MTIDGSIQFNFHGYGIDVLTDSLAAATEAMGEKENATHARVAEGEGGICWESSIILSEKSMEEIITVMKASRPLAHIKD